MEKADSERSRRGRRNRQRGSEGERELVKILNGARIRGRVLTARKDSRTGYSGTDLMVGEQCGVCEGFECVSCVGRSEEMIEVKRRKSGFLLIDKWLEDAYAVCYRRDRGEWTITMRVKDFIE